MSNFRKSLAALAGLALIVGLALLFTPASTQGQGQGGPPTRDVNVVNNPTVQASDLYPARPFQKLLVLESDGNLPLFEACTTVPAGSGLIIELVTLRSRGASADARLEVALHTTAGGETVDHNIALEREVIGDTSFAVTQPLRAYADPGTQLCIRAIGFGSGGFLLPEATVSGQLAPVAPSPAAPAQ